MIENIYNIVNNIRFTQTDLTMDPHARPINQTPYEARHASTITGISIAGPNPGVIFIRS
jgi:hypothetical protein